jgi:hypothetical protein
MQGVVTAMKAVEWMSVVSAFSFGKPSRDPWYVPKADAPPSFLQNLRRNVLQTCGAG